MDGRDNFGSKVGFNPLSPLYAHAKILSQKSLRRRGAQTNNDLSTEAVNLGIEPWPACIDFRRPGLVMNATFSAANKFEMFYDIGDIYFAAVKTCFIEGIIEDPPCWSNKRTASEIFFVAGLLT